MRYRLSRQYLPEAPVSVTDDGAGRFLNDRQIGAGVEFSVLHLLHVKRNSHHPVRIVSSQVCLNQTAAHDQRFRLVGSASSQQSDPKFLQLRFRQNRHSLSPSGMVI
jgi:hypothetical protein